jgi:ATP-binding cassette, subfamily C, bacterial CydC
VNGTLPALLRLGNAPRSRFALAAVLGALTVVCGVGLMATAGYLISRAAEHPPILSLMVAIVAVRVFGLGRPLIRYLERLASHDVALRVLGRVRAAFYARIEPLAPAQLDCYRRGDLLSRMVADVDALQDLYLRGLGPPLVALLAGAVAVGAAAALLPVAGLVLAAGLLVGGLAVPALSGSLASRAGRRQATARGELSADLIELIRGAPELVAYGADLPRLERVRAADARLVKLARRDALATGVGDGLGLAITGITVAGVLAAAVNASADGRLSPVLIATLALLALASFEAVTPLGEAARALSATLAAGRRILELTDREPAVVDPDEPAPPPAWPFAVALQTVRAGYAPGEPPVLDDFSLRLEAGRRVALVGASGAGKTTVVNLLLRFLDPEAGRVTLGGRDVGAYRQVDLRRAIAVAGQEAHLFSASIRENVRLARPEASDAGIRDALCRARIWEWVSHLPDGWDTLVGEEGRELSGGQRQRIVVARALLAEAPVLVLDEPTAHLDPLTAEQLMRDVVLAAGRSSLLLITHRSEGLSLMDEVVVLGD